MRVVLIISILSSCIGAVLAGGVGPPPNPLGIPLDGGLSALLVIAGGYIGYKALKNDDD